MERKLLTLGGAYGARRGRAPCSSLSLTTRQTGIPMSSSVHAVGDSTFATTSDRAASARGSSRGVQVQFFATEEGLHSLQISAAVPVALSLLDVLHRLGVVLAAFEVRNERAQQRFRFAVMELDGTAIRAARLQRLQSEILMLAERTGGQAAESPD